MISNKVLRDQFCNSNTIVLFDLETRIFRNLIVDSRNLCLMRESNPQYSVSSDQNLFNPFDLNQAPWMFSLKLFAMFDSENQFLIFRSRKNHDYERTVKQFPKSEWLTSRLQTCECTYFVELTFICRKALSYLINVIICWYGCMVFQFNLDTRFYRSFKRPVTSVSGVTAKPYIFKNMNTIKCTFYSRLIVGLEVN